MATSTLNPNAPIFVPSAYLAVEDFSDQWWDLIQSSSSFRDYWLGDFIFDDGIFNGNSIKEEEGKLDLVTLGQLKWRKSRGGMEIPRYCEKAPKIVNVKVNPRPIQQPR
ncbi:Hypothetical predicted protein [Olea europaea subsp. europaea]|uniref:Uncharacterized protein n=1 Tax=Olea europaea subsp. europaea TaxID=158383 RepID=A0A8S0QLU3_OLEEU|nr:Hypothetical predicted protein [Olea europaea subsp. europaea]